MRLTEWIIDLPYDMFMKTRRDNVWFKHIDYDELREYAISYVKGEISSDDVTPALWDAWVVGDMDVDDIEVCVTRLSNGDAFPQMAVGYCWEADQPDMLDSDDADMPVITPTGLEGYKGKINICTYEHNYWLCPDNKYRAQLTTLTGK